ncbi:hypothetical protein GYA13_00795 [Candidatus Kuenenbacteria bacterium]|nr:hypothetical protein [Candidatus Kuenenbacteria bacterium]
MKKIIVRTAPNISLNAGHYGHVLTFLVAHWVAIALGGRAVVRIDWQLKTKGSMHRSASNRELEERQLGFDRICHLSKLCGISEVIDEYGIRFSLDGQKRSPKYRVFKDRENNIPIIYDYGWDTLGEEELRSFLSSSSFELARLPWDSVDKRLPLIMEHTHICLSSFPGKYLPRLKEICIATDQLPRRFHKAYCHLQMDSLLGVTHVIRGDDFHSNRVANVHERSLNQEWGIPLFPIIRIPLVYCNGQKISASEDDGIIGLFPTSKEQIENMVTTVIKPKYLRHFLPVLDGPWFAELLKSDQPLLDAPIWSYKELSAK